MKSFPFIGLFLSVLFFNSTAQNADSTRHGIALSGYLETYYNYDLGRPNNHYRPGFLYSHNRHNEVNLNLGMLKANFESARVRGNLALMAGTYAGANLAAEPSALRYVMEANAGVRLSKSGQIWLDAGIFPSHIGFESAIGKDCWNLSRSLMAENSPYYESGIKLSYATPDGRWYLAALVLNGWQRIQRPDRNNTPAFGHQATFKPNSRITLNSSSFIGNDAPNDEPLMRYFHNFYGIFQLSNALGLTLGFDAGIQESEAINQRYESWYSPIVILRYRPVQQLAVAARAEYYADPDGVIISGYGAFKTFGYSLNTDYSITEQAMLRLEGRLFASDEPIFTRNGSDSRYNLAFSAAFCVSF